MTHWADDKTNVPAAVHDRLLQIARSERTTFDVLNREQLVAVNAHAIWGARFVYSPVQRFSFVMQDGQVGTGDILADSIGRAMLGASNER